MGRKLNLSEGEMDCLKALTAEQAARVGELLGEQMGKHEGRHHGGDECRAARIEVAAFVLHALKVTPEDAAKRLKEHMAVCDCHGRCTDPRMGH